MVKRRKKKFGLLLIMPLVFVAVFLVKKNEKAKESEEIKSLELKMKGIVTNVVRLKAGYDYGLIRVKLTETNVSYYDKRDQNDKFFGVVKGTIAEIVINGISGIKKGDEFQLLGEELKIYRGKKLVKDEYLTYLSGNIIYDPYDEVRKSLTL